jgi:hypothetical protein
VSKNHASKTEERMLERRLEQERRRVVAKRTERVERAVLRQLKARAAVVQAQEDTGAS